MMNLPSLRYQIHIFRNRILFNIMYSNSPVNTSSILLYYNSRSYIIQPRVATYPQNHTQYLLIDRPTHQMVNKCTFRKSFKNLFRKIMKLRTSVLSSESCKSSNINISFFVKKVKVWLILPQLISWRLLHLLFCPTTTKKTSEKLIKANKSIKLLGRHSFIQIVFSSPQEGILLFT